MPDHGIRLEQRHAVDHVLALADERRVAVLPGVAAVQEHDALAALGADRLEDGGDAIEPAEPAVALGERGEVERGQRVGRRRARLDVVEIEESLAGDMRNEPLGLADAEIGGRFAEQERHELGVDVGDVNERDVADRIEAQQLVLRQALLREGARPVDRAEGRCRCRHLQDIAPRQHVTLPGSSWSNAGADPYARGGATA